MQALLKPFRYIFLVWLGLVFMTIVTIFYPIYWVLIRKENRIPLLFEIIGLNAAMFRVLLFTPRKIVYEERLPEGPFIICPNHSSYYDIIFMYGIFKGLFIFMGKQELKKWPLFGIMFSKKYFNIAVDRGNKQSAAAAIKLCDDHIQKGHSIVMFPEGTVSRKPPKLGKFKMGAFQLAIQNQVPIVPVTFVNHWKLFNLYGKYKGAMPGVSKVVVHAPISTEGLTNDDVVALADKTRNIIESTMRKYNPEYDELNP